MLTTNQRSAFATLLYSAAVVSLAGLILYYAANINKSVQGAVNSSVNAIPAATFAASPASLGAIPDGAAAGPGAYGSPRNVTFDVSGLTGSISNVAVSFTSGGPSHTFRGDLEVVLMAPGGSPSHLLFARTGATSATSFGSGTDLTGPYVFNDTAAGTHWWSATANPTPPGSYRTVATGPSTTPPAVTSLNSAFASATVNGTWTLRFRDGASFDTGAVSAATLTVETATATPTDANVDINGDSKTDYVVARGTTTPLAENIALPEMSVKGYSAEDRRTPGGRRLGRNSESSAIAPPIYWYISINGSGTTGVAPLGDAATDFITPEDFDGDGKDDLAVWTEAPANSANFKILQSTTNTVRVDTFGQTGDDPAIVGDYDGDNKADPAVFRCPPISGADGQCYFFFRGSNNNPSGNITYVPWGFGTDGDFFPLIGDFDGDSKYDFCLQRANPSAPAQGQFVLLRSSDLGVEYINWGLSTDFLIPGDYDGDGKHDFCVRRTVSGNRQHWILTRTGATGSAVWGITGDVSVPGDYDGDGKTDLAIWRGNPDPSQNFFWIYNSSNGSITTFEWGQCPSLTTCDFPVAGWAVH